MRILAAKTGGKSSPIILKFILSMSGLPDCHESEDCHCTPLWRTSGGEASVVGSLDLLESSGYILTPLLLSS